MRVTAPTDFSGLRFVGWTASSCWGPGCPGRGGDHAQGRGQEPVAGQRSADARARSHRRLCRWRHARIREGRSRLLPEAGLPGRKQHQRRMDRLGRRQQQDRPGHRQPAVDGHRGGGSQGGGSGERAHVCRDSEGIPEDPRRHPRRHRDAARPVQRLRRHRRSVQRAEGPGAGRDQARGPHEYLPGGRLGRWPAGAEWLARIQAQGPASHPEEFRHHGSRSKNTHRPAPVRHRSAGRGAVHGRDGSRRGDSRGPGPRFSNTGGC